MREQGTIAFEKTQKEDVQEQRKRKPHKKEKEERAAKMEPLREKEDSQERAVREEENKKGESKVLLSLKEIISVCVRAKKKKRDFYLAVKYTQKLL